MRHLLLHGFGGLKSVEETLIMKFFIIGCAQQSGQSDYPTPKLCRLTPTVQPFRV